MRFRVGRDAFGEAVAFVSRALPSRPVVPLLSGMLMEAEGERLTISCFDYEVSARCRVDAEVIEAGTALVPGRLLAEITRSLPARPVECSRDADLLNLVCGTAEFGLVCLPADDYPALPESPAAIGTVDGGALAAAVSQVASSASRDDTLPMLTAIFVDVDGDLLTLAATDRYRLAARQVPVVPADPDLRAVALVPARIMVEATRMMAAAKPVTLAFDAGERAARSSGQHGRGGDDNRPHTAEGLISFEVAERRLTARLIGGEFIKYQSRLAGDFNCRADLAPGPVIEAVRRASLVAERAGPVRLTFGDGRVMIEAHAEGRARAAETIAADFVGDQPAISFNPVYLLDGLVAASVCATSESDEPVTGATGSEADREADESAAEGRIRLQFNTAARPALITWVSPGEARAEVAGTIPAFRYLLVPLRVPDRA
ncbi:MAG TPA: DNA polymerase III subunit beta [Streptosporangiaceae bacterium]|nr:DNA polymerase III subunit beta [Streptosporangiaceae bacterium]